MAKAVPFSKSITSKITMDRTHQPASLDDVKLKSLLITPEAKKMLELDKELSEIMNRSDLNANEKFKLYEVTLARYKIFQDKVIDKGYRLTNGMRGLSEKISELLQTIVNQHMQQSISLNGETDENTRNNTENETEFKTIDDAEASQIQQPQSSSTPIIHSRINARPYLVKTRKYEKEEEEQNDETHHETKKTLKTYEAPGGKLKKFLIRHGVKLLPSGDLYFSPSTKASSSALPSTVKGTEFDKIVDYLLTEENPELLERDRKTANFMKKIQAIMKKEKSLETVNDLITTFPILNNMKMQVTMENQKKKKKQSSQKGNGLEKKKIQKLKKWCRLR